jgi:predicted transglutaminase-like cysteine proteinase
MEADRKSRAGPRPQDPAAAVPLVFGAILALAGAASGQEVAKPFVLTPPLLERMVAINDRVNARPFRADRVIGDGYVCADSARDKANALLAAGFPQDHVLLADVYTERYRDPAAPNHRVAEVTGLDARGRPVAWILDNRVPRIERRSTMETFGYCFETEAPSNQMVDRDGYAAALAAGAPFGPPEHSPRCAAPSHIAQAH